MLSIESKEELDYVLGLLGDVRSSDLFWTSGIRAPEIIWDTNNATLSGDDMPEDFESYFRNQHPTAALAFLLTPSSPGGVDWAILQPTNEFRFICEKQTAECNNFTGGASKAHYASK